MDSRAPVPRRSHTGRATVAPKASVSTPERPGRDVLEPRPKGVADVARMRGAVPPVPLRTVAEVEAIVEDLIATSYPDLRDISIRVGTFRARDSFFRAQPRVGSLLVPFRRNRYVIEVNPRVFSLGLPISAARAIVAHELAHVRFYVDRGIGGMVATLWGQIVRRAGPRVERRTDMVAIRAGHGAGLAAFRRWLYPQLDPRQQAAKRRAYFTPEEIEVIVPALREFPDLGPQWEAHPPRSLEDIRADIEAAQSGRSPSFG